MGAKSRRKGATAEREFAKVLGDLVGEPELLCRNLEQCRTGGDDLRIKQERLNNTDLVSRLDGFSIEVKRYATAQPSAVRGWWQQSVRQARDRLKLPLLAYRCDRQPWCCVVHLSTEFPLDDLRGCLTMPIELFAEFLLRGLPNAHG